MIVFPFKIYLNCILYPKSKYKIVLLFPISLPQAQLYHVIYRMQPLVIPVLKKKKEAQSSLPSFLPWKEHHNNQSSVSKKIRSDMASGQDAPPSYTNQFTTTSIIIKNVFFQDSFQTVTFKLKTRHLKCTHKL